MCKDLVTWKKMEMSEDPKSYSRLPARLKLWRTGLHGGIHPLI